MIRNINWLKKKQSHKTVVEVNLKFPVAEMVLGIGLVVNFGATAAMLMVLLNKLTI